MYLTPNVRRPTTVAHRGMDEPSLARHPTRPVAKPGLARCGSAACGVFGFDQHLGLGLALLGGVGWLIGSDHVSFLLRRRYGARVGTCLTRWHRRGRLHARAVSLLQSRVVLPNHLADTPYRLFALINLAGAAGWGMAFVWTGYLLARSWHDGQLPWGGLAVLLATVGAIMWIDRRRQRRRVRLYRCPKPRPVRS